MKEGPELFAVAITQAEFWAPPRIVPWVCLARRFALGHTRNSPLAGAAKTPPAALRTGEKKRPVKRPGVKADGARLYIRFLAGGMRKVVKRLRDDKAKFPVIIR